MTPALQPSDPRKAGPYTLVECLGAGGMGQVYLGVSPAAEKVAVKIVRPDVLPDQATRQRFGDEVDNLRMVFGSRVARFEDADLEGDPPWLAVEYVPGRTLAQHVELHGPLGPDLVAILAAMLCEGLSKVHRVGLLHRDLKPQNIMLGPDGAKILDFGLAVLANRRAHLTDPGSIVGTIAYMPPEQARDGRDLTVAADVYALGATLAFAATGRLLYPSVPVVAVLNAVMDPDTLPDLSAVPAELAPLVAGMVAFDPVARPELMAVAAAMLATTAVPAAVLRQRFVQTTYPATSPVSLPALSLPDSLADPVVDGEGVYHGGSDRDRAGDDRAGDDRAGDDRAGDDRAGDDRAGGDRAGGDRAGGDVTVGPADPAGNGPTVHGPESKRRPRPGRPSPGVEPTVDVSWLVRELRADYARDARF
ncbi:serine/threonine-protein kinase [Frankia sp. BMG5.23]|uniref:serine/threonine-protein kinase n=1 Tax=Frankia sp. BMG5.23 TaxID=683305 RepID=UPI0005BBC649|nr:serine/threonine-protein kinase [Frankia sp. BMG5.23]